MTQDQTGIKPDFLTELDKLLELGFITIHQHSDMAQAYQKMHPLPQEQDTRSKEERIAAFLKASKPIKSDDSLPHSEVIESAPKLEPVKAIQTEDIQQRLTQEERIAQFIKKATPEEAVLISKPEIIEVSERVVSKPIVIEKQYKPKVKKVRKARFRFESERERNITLILGIGIIFLLLAGLVFATTAWESLTVLTKVLLIFSISMLFFGVGTIANKLKIQQTSFAFIALSFLFLPLSLISASFYEVFGHYLSWQGEGRYLFASAVSFAFVLIYHRVALKYHNRVFRWITLAVTYISFIFVALLTQEFSYLVLSMLIVGAHLWISRSPSFTTYKKEIPTACLYGVLLSFLIVAAAGLSNAFAPFGLLLFTLSLQEFSKTIPTRRILWNGLIIAVQFVFYGLRLLPLTGPFHQIGLSLLISNLALVSLQVVLHGHSKDRDQRSAFYQFMLISLLSLAYVTSEIINIYFIVAMILPVLVVFLLLKSIRNVLDVRVFMAYTLTYTALLLIKLSVNQIIFIPILLALSLSYRLITMKKEFIPEPYHSVFYSDSLMFFALLFPFHILAFTTNLEPFNIICIGVGALYLYLPLIVKIDNLTISLSTCLQALVFLCFLPFGNRGLQIVVNPLALTFSSVLVFYKLSKNTGIKLAYSGLVFAIALLCLNAIGYQNLFYRFSFEFALTFIAILAALWVVILCTQNVAALANTSLLLIYTVFISTLLVLDYENVLSLQAVLIFTALSNRVVKRASYFSTLSEASSRIAPISASVALLLLMMVLPQSTLVFAPLLAIIFGLLVFARIKDLSIALLVVAFLSLYPLYYVEPFITGLNLIAALVLLFCSFRMKESHLADKAVLLGFSLSTLSSNLMYHLLIQGSPVSIISLVVLALVLIIFVFKIQIRFFDCITWFSLYGIGFLTLIPYIKAYHHRFLIMMVLCTALALVIRLVKWPVKFRLTSLGSAYLLFALSALFLIDYQPIYIIVLTVHAVSVIFLSNANLTIISKLDPFSIVLVFLSALMGGILPLNYADLTLSWGLVFLGLCVLGLLVHRIQKGLSLASNYILSFTFIGLILNYLVQARFDTFNDAIPLIISGVLTLLYQAMLMRTVDLRFKRIPWLTGAYLILIASIAWLQPLVALRMFISITLATSLFSVVRKQTDFELLGISSLFFTIALLLLVQVVSVFEISLALLGAWIVLLSYALKDESKLKLNQILAFGLAIISFMLVYDAVMLQFSFLFAFIMLAAYGSVMLRLNHLELSLAPIVPGLLAYSAALVVSLSTIQTTALFDLIIPLMGLAITPFIIAYFEEPYFALLYGFMSLISLMYPMMLLDLSAVQTVLYLQVTLFVFVFIDFSLSKRSPIAHLGYFIAHHVLVIALAFLFTETFSTHPLLALPLCFYLLIQASRTLTEKVWIIYQGLFFTVMALILSSCASVYQLTFLNYFVISLMTMSLAYLGFEFVSRWKKSLLPLLIVLIGISATLSLLNIHSHSLVESLFGGLIIVMLAARVLVETRVLSGFAGLAVYAHTLILLSIAPLNTQLQLSILLGWTGLFAGVSLYLPKLLYKGFNLWDVLSLVMSSTLLFNADLRLNYLYLIAFALFAGRIVLGISRKPAALSQAIQETVLLFGILDLMNWSLDFVSLPFGFDHFIIPLTCIILVSIGLRYVWRSFLTDEMSLSKLESLSILLTILLMAQTTLALDKSQTNLIFSSLMLGFVVFGFIAKFKSYFLIGAASLIVSIVYNQRYFWTSLPWWAYLTIAGISLLLIGSVSEWLRQQKDKPKLKDRILTFFSQWR